MSSMKKKRPIQKVQDVCCVSLLRETLHSKTYVTCKLLGSIKTTSLTKKLIFSEFLKIRKLFGLRHVKTYKTGVYRGIHYFSYFCSKTQIVGTLRIASARRF